VTWRHRSLALRNLRQARLRTALTVLGVSIGIASLAGMVSLGVGLQDQFVGRFMRSGMFDAVTVLQAQDRPGFMAGGRMGGRRIRRPARWRPCHPARRRRRTSRDLAGRAGGQDDAALAHVKEVYQISGSRMELKYEDFTDQPS